MQYTISLLGCDDTTVFDMELTAAEKDLLDKVARLSDETSDSGCMPIMTIEAKPTLEE